MQRTWFQIAMSRPLVAVAVTGIGVSVISLSLASMMNLGTGPPFMFGPTGSRSYPWAPFPWTAQVPFVESGEIITREFNWNGAESAEIYLPGTVYFEQGPEWRVTATGRQSSVEHLHIDGGRIYFDGSLMYPYSSSIEVRITGPSLRSFGLKGSGSLVLKNIAQKRLEIDLYGSGSIRGQGRVEQLQVHIFGSGDTELGALTTVDVNAKIFGSGNADVAPTGDVDVAIFGSGDVRLHARPRSVATRTFGSGRTIQLAPGKGEEAQPGSGA
jgi:Putative auto-transporter adhesin, head GIN domain